VTSSAPYDRALALASLVRTMRDHYLAVRCSCGASRVTGLRQMAQDRRLVDCTLAHVALRLSCTGCHNGPDEVHLTATTSGVGPLPTGHQTLVWTLPLIERPISGAKQLRRGRE